MVKRIAKCSVLALGLLFIYTPILLLVVFSFTPATTLGVWEGFSFDLYIQLFNNAKIMNIVKDTLLLALFSAVISTVLGTAGAIGIFYSKKKVATTVNVMARIPVINAEIVTAVALALLFAAVLPDKSYFTLLMGHVVITVPFVVLSITPKLKQMDGNLYEAALDLGATPTKALFKVVVPEILPGMLSGFMLAVTLSLDDYIVTAFTRPTGFETISTYVYNSIKVPQHSALPQLRALSAIIFIVIIVGVIVANIPKDKKKRKEKV
ncbi:MAG: ABC transporter permease [Clostridia bacterium]|nr:ABC transporter permease [Clostridia bacterium]